MALMLKLLLIRHGQSQGNVEGRMEGWHSSDLTVLGREQSYRLGQYLAAINWSPTHIYCSPLLRATATLVTLQSGWVAQEQVQKDGRDRLNSWPPTILSEELRENNQGIFSGLTWAEAKQRYPDLCRTLETSSDWQPIPQAETLSEGQQRAQQFINHLLNQHCNDDHLWVISHSWILQQLIAQILGCDRVWGIPIRNTAIFEFWLDCSRWHSSNPNHHLNSELWQIKRFNDYNHLLYAS
ncbi:MAG: histidine phosphatase family protein [Leptolyngbyaceae cyanobacterium SM2_5_2]|nr:histidine phosphatase family protein [Leptolyngbyaceae cyanobacterium SM2_5_2]